MKLKAFFELWFLALFDETPIGQYKRICDYVIESVHESKLWEQNQKIARSILFGYIKLKPIYKKIIAEKREEKGLGAYPKSSILEELEKKNTDFTFKDLSFDFNDIDLLDIYDLEIIYQLIPSNTKDKNLLDIYTKSLQLLSSHLLKDSRSYHDDFSDGSDIYHYASTFSKDLHISSYKEIKTKLTNLFTHLSILFFNRRNSLFY